MNAQVNIPEGYWLDPKGNLVPDANVKEIDKLRDQTVRRIWALAEALHQEMKNFKATSFDVVAKLRGILKTKKILQLNSKLVSRIKLVKLLDT